MTKPTAPNGKPTGKETPDVRRTLAVNRALLATAPGREKLRLILDQPDPKKFVRALPAEDLYFAVKEIGLDDSAEVVGLATPNQFRTFVDLDAWEKDAIQPMRVLAWLRLAWEGKMGDEAFRAQRAGLDAEVVLYLLKHMGTVHPYDPEGEGPAVLGDNVVRTAEGKYLFDITAEGDDGVMARRIVEDFIEENPFEATRLFEATRWELDSELEENILRWRTARLRELGFPDLEEAIKVWTPLPATWKPRETAPAHGPVSGVPALLFATSRAALFLDRATERLADDDRPAFNEGLVYLLNCALVADGIDPRDLDLARTSLGAARDTLSLGLELASDGNLDVAAGILATTPAVELFRRAVTEVVELQKQANSVAKQVAYGSGSAANVDSPDADLLGGLRKRRPRLYDPPPAGEKRPEGAFRAFRDRLDLARARDMLERIHARVALAHQAGVTKESFAALADAAGRTPTATTLDQALRTALAHGMLGHDRKLQPLQEPHAAPLTKLFQGDWRTAFEAQVKPWLDALEPAHRKAAREVVDGWLRELGDGIETPAKVDTIDPRFVEAVLFEA